MSQWIDRIKANEIWSSFTALDSIISDALNRKNLSSDEIDSIERLKTVAIFCCSRIQSIDPALIPVDILPALRAAIDQMRAHLETFLRDGEFSQLNSANQQADSALKIVAGILGISSKDDLLVIGKSADSYRATLEKYLKEALEIQNKLSEESAKNKNDISKLKNDLIGIQQQIEKLLTDQQSAFSTAQDKRASDFAEKQAEFLAKYTEAIADQKSQFSADQDLRKTMFSELQADGQQKIAGLISESSQKLKDQEIVFKEKEKQVSEEHASHLEELKTKYEKAANEILVKIEKHKVEVESLVGVIGNLGVTSGYKKVADRAEKTRKLWQFLTAVSLAGLIFVAFLVAFPNVLPANSRPQDSDLLYQQKPSTGLSVQKSTATLGLPDHNGVEFSKNQSDVNFYHGFITRIFLSLAFGIFAAYAGKQATRFFDIEQKNRKLALELEALGPFIEPLDKVDRDKFRVQVGDRSFGVPDKGEFGAKESDPVTVMDLFKSTDELESFFTKLKALFSLGK